MNQDLYSLIYDTLEYCQGTGVFTWRVNRGKARVGMCAGTTTARGYTKIGVGRDAFLAHRLAWLFAYGEFPTVDIDHINGNRADNRLCNLREATRAQNMQNLRGPVVTNKSGFLGVDFNKSSGSWRAQIRINGVKKYLGVFDTPEKANHAYLLAKQNFHEFSTIQKTADIHHPERIPQLGVSGKRGVSWSGGKWVVYAPRKNGKQEVLGRFTSRDEAIETREKFDIEHLDSSA